LSAIRPSRVFRVSSPSDTVIAVCTNPGAIALTVTLRDPISSANALVKPMMPAFDAA
jgi:hypothetical protein